MMVASTMVVEGSETPMLLTFSLYLRHFCFEPSSDWNSSSYSDVSSLCKGVLRSCFRPTLGSMTLGFFIFGSYWRGAESGLKIWCSVADLLASSAVVNVLLLLIMVNLLFERGGL